MQNSFYHLKDNPQDSPKRPEFSPAARSQGAHVPVHTYTRVINPAPIAELERRALDEPGGNGRGNHNHVGRGCGNS